MFERFTERARQVVVLAQDEARALKHNYIGTEHLLLGLLREEEGIAARVLVALGVTLENARGQIARVIGIGNEAATGQIPFTPRAKRALELSLREALSLGHNYIGTEHLLLGLVRDQQGAAARVLVECGADGDSIRNEIIRQLSGGAPAVPYAELHRPALEDMSDYTRHDFEATLQQPEPGDSLSLRALVLGWLLGVATLGLGLLLGWLIWG